MSNKNLKYFTNGLIKENPVLRLVLGTCPTLAITTAAINGIGMGVAATLVLVGSNLVISLLRNVIPNKVRIPAFITIIASFVTIIQMLVKAFLPAIDAALGIYLPLIVVNCIILARAEMFACKNPVLPSVLDGLGMGIGFTAVITLMGAIRELIGAGSVFGLPITSSFIDPMIVMLLPPGGFFVFGVLVAVSNKLAVAMGKKPAKSLGCANCPGNCNGCTENCGEAIAQEATEQVKEPQTEVEAKTETETNSQPEAEVQAEAEADAETKDEVQAETEPEAKAEEKEEVSDNE